MLIILVLVFFLHFSSAIKMAAVQKILEEFSSDPTCTQIRLINLNMTQEIVELRGQPEILVTMTNFQYEVGKEYQTVHVFKGARVKMVMPTERLLGNPQLFLGWYPFLSVNNLYNILMFFFRVFNVAYCWNVDQRNTHVCHADIKKATSSSHGNQAQ